MTIPAPIVPFIAQTIPAKIDRVSDTTLFRIAASEFNDAMQWVPVAQLNGVIDPWIFAQTDVKIPPVLPTGTPTGLLLVTPSGATAGIGTFIPPVSPTPPNLSSSSTYYIYGF